MSVKENGRHLGTLTETPLGFTAGYYTSRVLNSASLPEAEAFQHLRFDYFVQQRGWVAEDPAHPGRESDCYDPSSQHLAVFKDERLVAYMRALPWRAECGFMLEHEFCSLVPTEAERHLVRHVNAVELTRLVVASHPVLSLREVPLVSELLFKLFYQSAQRQGWEHLYIVVEQGWLPVFRRRFGFSFKPLGPPHTFPDGTRTVAAQAHLMDLEAALAQNCPEKLHWYREL